VQHEHVLPSKRLSGTHYSRGKVGVCGVNGRVFVYLPLVGENRNNDEKNDGARAGKPREARGNA
jgi:hypothetical protein